MIFAQIIYHIYFETIEPYIVPSLNSLEKTNEWYVMGMLFSVIIYSDLV